MDEFTRICPTCGRTVAHATVKSKNAAEKCGRKCTRCPKIGRDNPNYGNPLNRVPWNKGMKGIHYPNFPSRVGKNNPMYGVNRKGKKAGFFGKKHTEETKRKKRLLMIERIKKLHGRACPNYNQNAIQIIEEYGRTHGYEFRHAENGGEFYVKELGYWVDGYDEGKNVVIEYYEPHHKARIKKDTIRRNEIVSLLGCKFIELKEWELPVELNG